MAFRGTRREILQGLLGLAAGACAPKAAALDFDGALVDDGMVEGHRLRDGWKPSERGPITEVPILIIGGGVAGLSAAWRLAQRGVGRFQLLELGRGLGGTAIGGQGPAGGYPWGAHYLPGPLPHNQDLIRLLREVGAALPDDGGPLRFAEEHLVAEPKERVWYRGTWYPGLYPQPAISRADAEDLARFEAEVDALVGARGEDGRRPFTLPLALSSQDPRFLALDQLSFADWLKSKGHDSALVRYQADYACRDDFGTEPETTSAWYGLHYFAARIAAPGQDSAELLAWPDGNAFLVEHFKKQIGPRTQPGVVVLALAPTADGRRVQVQAYDRLSQTPLSYLAERVILAVPGHVRRHLLAAFPQAITPEAESAPWLVANLQLADRPGYEGVETAWDNVILGSRSLGYVVNNHRDGPTRGPTVWTYYLPLTGSDPKAERQRLLSLSWREAADLVLADLERCHRDLRPNLRRLDVWRWGHGMVRPLPGTLQDPRRRAAAQALGPLHFAHTDLSGVALFEEAFFHGLRAADEVHQAVAG